MHTPANTVYDVVIIGGAMYGSSAAWWLTENKDFDGSILVVEKDPSYEFTSTSHTNSCMRQQFSAEINIRISQFAADFIKNIRQYMGGDERVPHLALQSFGYMYLADNEDFAKTLRESQITQKSLGAGTKHMNAAQIKADYPFYNMDDILCGNHNLIDEGYFDGNTFDQNAIIGPHTKIENFMFLNGFSGHGFQQSPAMGRGIAEHIATGSFQTLDLTPFGFDRIERNEAFIEKAVI